MHASRQILFIIPLCFAVCSCYVQDQASVYDNFDPAASIAQIQYLSNIRSSASQGANWLARSRSANAEFEYGWIPSLGRPMPGQNDLRQAGAALSLARAARVLRDPTLENAARESVLRLLHTRLEIDPKTKLRVPSAGKTRDNLVGFAGLMLAAIAEFPKPDAELRKYADGIAAFLISRQRADGSFFLGVGEDDGDENPQAIDYYPGEALYGLARSALLGNTIARRGSVMKALEFHRKHFRQRPSAAFVPWQTQAFAELYLQTGDSRSRDFVFEMNDWIVPLQYSSPHDDAAWIGGFADYEGGMVVSVTPGATTGSYAESLVHAWLVARKAGDGDRRESYSEKLSSSFQFLTRLQYTSEYGHFTPEALKKIEGAFFAAVDDGSIRVDYTQHALCAMLTALEATERFHQESLDAIRRNQQGERDE